MKHKSKIVQSPSTRSATKLRESTENLSLQKNANSKKKKKRSTKIMVVGSKRFKINVRILREIKTLQTSVSLLIPKLSFARVVKEILYSYGTEHYVQKAALEALQEAAEGYVVQYFEDCYACCLHARRCTLIPRDFGLVQYLRRPRL